MTGIIYIFWLLVWCWLVAFPAALCHAIVSSGMSLECSITREGSRSSRSSSSAELSKVNHQHFWQLLFTSPRSVAVTNWLLNQQQITALFPCWLTTHWHICGSQALRNCWSIPHTHLLCLSTIISGPVTPQGCVSSLVYICSFIIYLLGVLYNIITMNCLLLKSVTVCQSSTEQMRWELNITNKHGKKLTGTLMLNYFANISLSHNPASSITIWKKRTMWTCVISCPS